jgi:diadenosine tetraphosphatase ApaH/serine/threonine PP2A family protein phosphatase
MIAVISDVHANLPALEAVLADIDQVAPGVRIWNLGDTVGYGPFVNECMALVRERCEVVLAGNHDLAIGGSLAIAEFGGSAGKGLEYADRVIDDVHRIFLRTLQPSWQVDGIELHHGSARDPIWEYVRDELVALKHLKLQETPLGLVGHSHAQLVYELPDGAEAVTGGATGDGVIVPLSVGVARVANPGSVGQPRDRDPRAAWALLEPKRLTFHRVEYDIARMQAAVEAAGLPPETGERLELGW